MVSTPKLVDINVGKNLRQRRIELCMSQKTIGEVICIVDATNQAVGLPFSLNGFSEAQEKLKTKPKPD